MKCSRLRYVLYCSLAFLGVLALALSTLGPWGELAPRHVVNLSYQGALAPEKEREIAKELNDYGKAHEDIRFYGPGVGVGVPGEGKVRLGKGYGKSLITKVEDLEEMLGEEVEVVFPRNLPDGPKTLLWPYGRFPFLPASVEAKERDSAEAVAEIFERHGLETEITTIGANTAEQVVNPLTIGVFVLALGAGLGLRSSLPFRRHFCGPKARPSSSGSSFIWSSP